MKSIFLSFLLALLTLPLLAQTSDEVKRQINKIKRDDAYMSHEAQDSTQVGAEEYAYLALLADVNDLRRKQGQDSLTNKYVLALVKKMSYQRISSFVGFAYISVREVQSLKSGIAFAPSPSEVPVVTSSVDVTSVASSDSVASTASALSVPVVAEEVAPPVEEPKKPASFVPYIPTATKKSQVLLSLSSMEMMNEAYRALGDYQREGAVGEFARMDGQTSLQDDYHLLIFAKDAATGAVVVRAVLQASGHGEYTNVKTSQPDTYKNYKGCGAVWFRLK